MKYFAVLLVVMLSACSSGRLPVHDSGVRAVDVVDLRRDAPEVYREILHNPGSGKVYPALPIRYEEEVDRFVSYYAREGRPYVVESLSRKSDYAPLLRAIFAHYGLPTELVNVAAIESKFIADAQSPAGAYGIWQFMPATARSEGLEVSFVSDERGDVIKSTIAAAKYFQRLYDYFGDWYLALAAYNGGMGRVMKVVRASGSRDFFTIVRNSKLCRETSEYVPKIIAYTLIMRNLDLYGFLPPEILDAKS